MAATTPAGLYNVGVTSTGLTGSGFPTAGGQTSQGRGRLTEPCPAPTVTIASKPVTLVTAGAPGSYRATLTAAGNPAGGTYSWSAGNPNYSQFFLLFSGTQNSAAATLTVVSPTVLDPGGYGDGHFPGGMGNASITLGGPFESLSRLSRLVLMIHANLY